MLPRRAAAAALAVAAAASGWLLLRPLGASEDDPAPAAARGAATAAVTRQTLVERETVEGTLAYADSRPVINRLGSAGGGGGSPANEFASYTPDQEPSETTPQGTTPDETAPEPDRSSPEPSPRRESPGDDPSAGDGTGSGGGPPSGNGTGSGGSPSRGEGTGSGGSPSSGNGTGSGGSPSRGEGTGSAGSPSSGGRSGSLSPVAPLRGGGSGPGGAPPGSDSGTADPVTLTSTASPGSVVGRGGVLYRVDGEPAILLYGSTPAYRDLSTGAEGRDVLQLERNLAALGFAPGAVDETFTSDTAAAVSRWQAANDLPETGTVELGRVVFLPGERRVGEREATVGAPLAAGAEVMETTSTRRVVTIELDATKQSLAREGAAVDVTLPSQSTVRGRIASVGRVAREKESSTGAGAPDASADDQELVIDVTVRLKSLRGVGRLDEAPVSVALASQSARDVLAVPVTALAARPGGGYGVELAGSGRIVPVEAGLFAGGYVEISGRGVREGTRVVVPDA